MKTLIKQTNTYWASTETAANEIIEDYKSKQSFDGYTVTKTKIDYKVKKDRKTGEIVEEKWVVDVTITYEV